MRTYRASSLGSCTKQQIALQLGYQPLATPDKVEGWYERGRDHEDDCLVAMYSAGWVLLSPADLGDPEDEGQHYIELKVAGAIITGHLDGKVMDDVSWLGTELKPRVLEIKSPQSFHKWERAHKTGDYSDPLMNRYAWQISVYMAATGLEAVVACVEDGTVKTFGIEVAPWGLEYITARVSAMELYVEEGTMPPCSQADYPCPVAYLHEKAEYEEDTWLDNLTWRHAEITRAEKDLKVEKDSVRDAILTHLGGQDAKETASSKVTRYSTTRKSYDYESIALNLKPGVTIDDFITEKATESVRITKKEGGS